MGGVEAQALAIAYELFDDNTGDVRLGIQAGIMGAQLRSGELKPAELGQRIRDELCNK